LGQASLSAFEGTSILSKQFKHLTFCAFSMPLLLYCGWVPVSTLSCCQNLIMTGNASPDKLLNVGDGKKKKKRQET